MSIITPTNVPTETAARHNAGKPELSYLLDMKNAFYALCFYSDLIAIDPVESIAEFTSSKGINLDGKDKITAAIFEILFTLERELRGCSAIEIDPIGGNTPTIGDIIARYPKAFAELAHVFSFGAQKYARGDWLKGRPFMDTLDSAMRHYAGEDGYLTGTTHDKESGRHHLAHVIWNLMVILEYLAIHPELDDRVIRNETK